jgi:hypothetical protein
MILFVAGKFWIPNLLKACVNPPDASIEVVTSFPTGTEAAERAQVKLDCMRDLRCYYPGGSSPL